ncbi:hypothetical protein HK097_005895, partial [Rhizophlyctis rosea]
EQTIDFFGEIAGVSFTPGDAEGLFIGNTDPKYGCILDFEQVRYHPPAINMEDDLLWI